MKSMRTMELHAKEEQEFMAIFAEYIVIVELYHNVSHRYLRASGEITLSTTDS